jgi:hypothetical protein
MMSNNVSLASPPASKRGYHKLAAFMASQKETAIFCRFTKLNLLNLMSLQAELIELEEDFDLVWDADEKDPERRIFSVNFNALRMARVETTVDDDSEAQLEQQWRTLMAIRRKLHEYSRLSSASTGLFSSIGTY